ncbi:MAG TPA: S53 family peptidase [Gaiellaceae bacterium]|nr:S53 family peptidase [Gaiellaceae bacterium]
MASFDTSQCSITCYTPQNIQAAYDYPTGRRAPTGRGQTIVIVDAYATDYESATGVALNDDLAAFDSLFGISAPPGGGVTVVPGPAATCTGDDVGVDCSGDAAGWAGEIALDVEYAHAMAPDARIVLASASSDSNADINAAEAAVLPRYPGAIVSQSFGSDEAGDYGDPADETAMHKIFESATLRGDTLIASAGDWGAGNGDPYVMASYPASDPLVLSVGGTQGLPYPTGLLNSHNRYGGEEVWNEPQYGDIATGGAPSVVWKAPIWQYGLTQYSSGSHAMRTVPDVSYDAAVDGGVLTVEGASVWISGGTSAGSPQWAGIIALADQARAEHGRGGLGLAAVSIYAVSRLSPSRYRADFHDITVGNNAQGSGNAPIGSDAVGFNAGRGYDLATGLGTPDVSNLIDDLDGGPSGSFPGGSFGGPQGNGHGRGHHWAIPGK